MHAYRTSTKIKLGLILAAILIAAISLFYTNALADRVTEQEQAAVRLWVRAIEYQAQTNVLNPHTANYDEISRVLDEAESRGLIDDQEARRLGDAVNWAKTMPPTEELDFVFNEIIEPARFNVPAIITDSLTGSLVVWRNVKDDSSFTTVETERRLLGLVEQFDEENTPIRFEYQDGQVQYVHYGDSELARLIRWFPPIQLGFVALFILVGYLGFSYVRRSEQSNLWVGMAKEAAHQLGTPLSSMIGWIELLRLQREDDAEVMVVADELETDVERLRRVADRFEKIGSVPELSAMPLSPVLEHVADYIRRRIPKSGPNVSLDLYVPSELGARLNRQLFEWVIENLLKNALDAMDGNGQIIVEARREGHDAVIEVRDTGRGIERTAQRHIFRPGFSTKRRGWGLGLSLARRIVVQYHGGSLLLKESRPGAGTTFEIRLAAVDQSEIEPSSQDGSLLGATA